MNVVAILHAQCHKKLLAKMPAYRLNAGKVDRRTVASLLGYVRLNRVTFAQVFYEWSFIDESKHDFKNVSNLIWSSLFLIEISSAPHATK